VVEVKEQLERNWYCCTEIGEKTSC